jgi:hypothetical protein
VALQDVRLHKAFIVVVPEERVELVIANAGISVERPLSQDFPFVDMEFGKTLYENLVEVVLAYNRIQFNLDIGINLAKVLDLLAQSVETDGLSSAFPPNFHVGLMIQRVDGYPDLGNQVREGADIFEVAAVGDDGDFHLITVRCLHNIPQTFGEHNRLATDNVQADSKNTLTAEMLTNVRKYFPYIVRIAPDFGGLVPLGEAKTAAIVAGFGDVPVDDDCLDVHNSFSPRFVVSG